VLLLRNKDQEYNNPLASFATYLCWQRSELRTCAKRVRASRSRLYPDGPRVHLSGPVCKPSCTRPEVRFPLDQRVLCSDCCKKNVGYYV